MKGNQNNVALYFLNMSKEFDKMEEVRSLTLVNLKLLGMLWPFLFAMHMTYADMAYS